MKCLFNLFSAFVGTMFFMPVNAAESAADYNVVPQPRSIAMQKGESFVWQNMSKSLRDSR